MPPLDTSPPSVVRYLTRLLTALCLERGGELRIPLKGVRVLEQEPTRQMLIEDTNVETDELVLRFGTKHSAVFPVDSECVKTSATTPQTSQPTSTLSSQKPSVRKPQ